MSIVRNLVSRSLNNRGLGSYVSQAEPVVADLEAALDSAVSSLRSAGRTLGASEEQVNTALINAGLVERPAPVIEPTPEPAQAAGFPDAAAAIAALVEKVDALTAAARRAGVRV